MPYLKDSSSRFRKVLLCLTFFLYLLHSYFSNTVCKYNFYVFYLIFHVYRTLYIGMNYLDNMRLCFESHLAIRIT